MRRQLADPEKGVDAQRPIKNKAASIAQRLEAPIGKVIINFAHLEGILAELIANLTIGVFDDEELRLRIAALISGQSFNQLVARLSAQIYIAAPNNAKFLKQLQVWISRAERAASVRNRFAHQQLVFRNVAGDVEIEWALYNARASKKGFSADFSPMRPEELLQLSRNISKLTTDLFDLIDAMIKDGFCQLRCATGSYGSNKMLRLRGDVRKWAIRPLRILAFVFAGV